MLRVLQLLLTALLLTGCEMVGDIFQAGILAGVLVVLAILGIIAWLVRRARGRGT
jgi:TRAP-type C4-dicarboxylate transport system permease large subunit